MTRLIGAVMAVALLVAVAPVVAGDSFHALSRLPAGLSPLDDAQLATVEGGQVDIDICVGCANVAVVIITIIQIAISLDAGDIVQEALGAAALSQEVN